MNLNWINPCKKKFFPSPSDDHILLGRHLKPRLINGISILEIGKNRGKKGRKQMLSRHFHFCRLPKWLKKHQKYITVRIGEGRKVCILSICDREGPVVIESAWSDRYVWGLALKRNLLQWPDQTTRTLSKAKKFFFIPWSVKNLIIITANKTCQILLILGYTFSGEIHGLQWVTLSRVGTSQDVLEPFHSTWF